MLESIVVRTGRTCSSSSLDLLTLGVLGGHPSML